MSLYEIVFLFVLLVLPLHRRQARNNHEHPGRHPRDFLSILRSVRFCLSARAVEIASNQLAADWQALLKEKSENQYMKAMTTGHFHDPSEI